VTVAPSSPPPRFPFVAIDVDAADADEASSVLFDLGAQGVEERDDTTLVKGAPGKSTLVASFTDHATAKAAVDTLAADARGWSPRLEEVVGDAWRDAWKEHFRPFTIAPGIIVRPPWEPYDVKPDEAGRVTVLELEPGRAFGTGLHETTSLVARVLVEQKATFEGGAALDVGCGSGILCLVALLAGAARARAVDNDADVIEVVRENADRNGLGDRVETDTTDVADVPGSWDIVVANIEADVLIRLAEPLVRRTRPGKLLVLSGILAPQESRVREAFAARGALHVETKSAGEWVAIVLRGPKTG
jgi:ribosomal protein L11 methyltransferase